MQRKEYVYEQVKKYRLKYPERVRESLAKSRKNFPERNLYNKAKNRCKKSGLDFTITQNDIKIPEVCPLLKVKLDSWGPSDFCPSLDRVDNSKGYTPDNIWVISTKANRMKNTATKQELVTFAQSILDVIKFQ